MTPVRIFPGTPDFINLAITEVAQELPSKSCTHVAIRNDSGQNLIVSRANGTVITLHTGTERTFRVRSNASELSVALAAAGNYALEAEIWG